MIRSLVAFLPLLIAYALMVGFALLLAVLMLDPNYFEGACK